MWMEDFVLTFEWRCMSVRENGNAKHVVFYNQKRNRKKKKIKLIQLTSNFMSISFQVVTQVSTGIDH